MLRSVDDRALQSVSRLRTPRLTWAMIFITNTGYGRVWFSLAGVLWLLTYYSIEILPAQTSFLVSMIPALVACGSSHIFKRIVQRNRPDLDVSVRRAATFLPKNDSFPSSHAATSIALAAALMITGHPLALFVWPWAVLVAFSRFYLGVHYATDVLAGAVLGLACGWLIIYL